MLQNVQALCNAIANISIKFELYMNGSNDVTVVNRIEVSIR